MKSNLELATEIIQYVRKEMIDTEIFELEFTTKLPYSRAITIIKEVKDILSSEYTIGDLLNGNLLVWNRNKSTDEYIQSNFKFVI